MALEESQAQRIDAYGRQLLPKAYDVPVYNGAAITPTAMPGVSPFGDVAARVDSTEQMIPVGAAATAPVKPGSWMEFVSKEEARAGKKLDDEQIATAAELYKATVLIPRLAANKATKEQREASVGSFDAKLGRFVEDYKKAQQAAAAPGTEGRTDDNWSGTNESGPLRGAQITKDLGVEIGSSALLGTLKGILGLGDAGLRLGGKILGDFGGGNEQRDSAERAKLMQALGAGSIPEVLGALSDIALGGTSPTFLSDMAQGVGRGQQSIRDSLVSDTTKNAQDEFGRRFSGQSIEAPEDQGALNALAYGVQNPGALTGVVGDLVGALIPAGAAGRVGSIRTAVAGLSKFGQKAAPIIATGLPLVGRSAVEFETQIQATPISELTVDPENAQLYEQLKVIGTEFGLPDNEVEKKFKSELASRGIAASMTTSALSNLALPFAAGRFGLERLAFGADDVGRTGSRLGAAAKAVAAQAPEEFAGEYSEQVGGNVATNEAMGASQQIDPTTGAADAGTLGAILAAAAGGGLAAIQRPRNPLRSVATLPPVEETTTPASIAGTPPPAATVAPVAETPAALTTDVGAVPGEGIVARAHAGVIAQAADAAAIATARPNTKKAVSGLDAEGVIMQATDIAFRAAGSQWAGMTALQRLDAVEAAAETLNKIAKKDEVATTLGAMRNTLNAAPTPAAPIAPTPAPPAATETPAVPAVASVPAPPVVEAPPAPVESAPAPVAAPPIAPAAAQETPLAQLPASLAKSAPRYANGPSNWLPQFESDVDKAFYIIGQGIKSKADPQFRQFLTEQGFAEQDLDKLAKMMRANVAAQVQQVKGGTPRSPAKVTIAASNIGEAARGNGIPQPANPPANPKKKNPLKKETTPPKTEAPAATPGQATRESATAAIQRIAPDVEAVDSTELVSALELAREGGGTQSLNSAIKDLELSPEQARMLREAAAAQIPAQEGLTESDGTAPGSVQELWAAAINNPDAEKGAGAQQLLAGVAKLEESTAAEKWLANKLAPLMRTLQIGVSNVAQERIEQTKKTGRVLHGSYNSNNNHLQLTTSGQDVETVLHEALHAVTSNLLRAKATTTTQKKFQQDMDGLLTHVRDYLNTRVKTDKAFVERLNAEDADGSNIAGKLLQKDGWVGNTSELVSYGLTDPRFRQLLSEIPAPSGSKASNAWAAFKNFIADLLGANTVAERTALDALIEQTAEIVSAVEANPFIANQARTDRLLGNEAKYPGNRNRGLLESEASQDIGYLGIDASQSATNAPKIPQNVDVTSVSNAQRIGETLAQAAYGLEKSESEVRKAGGTVTPENSPYYASRKYTSDIAENRNTDNMEVVQPLENWIAANWKNFKVATVEEFRTELDKFVQNYHTLTERNPSIWANNVKLRGGAELQRATLIDDAYEGKLTGPQLNAALIKLAQQNAVDTQEEWTKANPARDPERARKALAEAQKKGFTTTSLKDFNALLQNVRDRARQRMDASGITSPEDPFADRGWEWYVPLKGALSADADLADLDIGARPGNAKDFRDRNIKALKGRSTNAANAVEQLLVDMNEAATAQAEGEFKSTLFQYVTDNQEMLGADIRRWEGTPKQGYDTATTYTKGGKKIAKTRHARELPNPKFGFIYNDGTNHFEVRLPQGSQLDRGLKGIRSVASPSTFEESNGYVSTMFRGLGEVTNLMARAYTTWSPTWQLMTAFMRDVNALPLTVAIESFDSPWKARVFATQYAKNLLGNMGALAGGQGEWKALLGDHSAMRAYADANPESYVAKLLAYRAAGGSTEFSQGLNRQKAGDLLFDKARRQDGDLLSVENAKGAYNKWNEVTGNWAALLESKGRVAAWEALMATGMEPKPAAAIVKGALDYGQSGEWGKLINIVHAFYRVGATSADTIRRAFTAKDGSLDKKKVQNWVPFISAAGGAMYMLLSAALGDDEEGKPRIRKYTLDTLTQKMVIPTGDGEVASTPIGLGLPQLMLAPGIIAAAVANGHATPTEGTRAYYETITRNTPIQPAGWRKGTGASGFANSWLQGLLVPTPAMPLVESTVNTNAFDGPIRTDFPSKDKFASDQGMKNTPQFWKDTANTVREVAGIDMYPETIRHFIKSWGGQPANNVIRWTLDNQNKEDQGMDSRAVRTALKLGVNDEDFYYRNEARKAMDTLTVSKREFKNATETDGIAEDKWLSQNPQDAKRIAGWKELDKSLDAYYKRINAIQNNKLMSSDGRKTERKKADSQLREAVNKAERLIEATDK